MSALRVALLSAALGVIYGLFRAVQQVSSHAYLAQGLVRTSVWTASEHTLRGAAVGGAAGLILALLILLDKRLIGMAKKLIRLTLGSAPGASPLSPSLPGLVVILGVGSVVAALFVPSGDPVRLHLPYSLVMVTSFVTLWLVVIGRAIAVESSDLPRSSRAARLEWLVAIGLAYVVVFLRTWAGLAPRSEKVSVAVGGLLAAIVAYRILVSRVGRVTSLVHRTVIAVGRRPAGRALPYLIVGLAATLWATAVTTRASVVAQTRRHGRNVVLIGVDTLRTDRVSLLSRPDDGRDLTLHLRSLLAKRGRVYTNAITQAPWTLPAFASIFTGLYPEQHGADQLSDTLPFEALTLAEILRDRGWQTLGVVSHGYVGSSVHMDQGFVTFDESSIQENHTTHTSAQVTDRALSLLQQREEPFFLFLHYFDPHYNYLDSKEFNFADHYAGWLRGREHDPHLMTRLQDQRHLIGPTDRTYLRDLYDEEVAYTDRHIGRLLAYLEEAKLLDSTLVILVADHGEEFYDHGWIGHVTTLHEELVHVPLVIADPAREGPDVYADPVETRWLFGTVLDFLGIALPESGATSPSLLGNPSNEGMLVRSSTHPALDPTESQEGSRYHVWLSCLSGKRWKLIKDHLRNVQALYDRATDPGEMHDVSDDYPDVCAEMERRLSAKDAALARPESSRDAPEADEEWRRQLRSLGYL